MGKSECRNGKYSKGHWDEKYQYPDETPIRRYRKFEHFESILREEELWFARADQFPDDFEGTITKMDDIRIDRLWDNFDMDGVGDIDEGFRKRARMMRSQTYLNCWRIGQEESAVVWDAYLQGEYGVAIETTIGKLKKHLEFPCTFEWGRIRYLDYLDEWMPRLALSQPEPFFHKRNAFWLEQEFRMAAFPHGFLPVDASPDNDLIKESYGETPTEKQFSVNLNKMIDSIYLAPNSPDWFIELVSQQAGKHLNSFEIKESALDQHEPMM